MNDDRQCTMINFRLECKMTIIDSAHSLSLQLTDVSVITINIICNFHNSFRMLRPGGFLFFRETHFTCACSCDTTNNAGQYRTIKVGIIYFWIH